MPKKQTTLLSPLFDSFNVFLATKQPPHNRVPAKHLADYEMAWDFLKSYRGSEATFNAYRREVERFLQWTIHIAEKKFHEIKRIDFENFINFCQHPPVEWVGDKNVPRYIEQEGLLIANPEWRPFVQIRSKQAISNIVQEKSKKYQLSEKSLQEIFAILGSFFNFLIAEDYLSMNPVAQIRQKSKYIRKQQHQAVVRRLSELQWGYVLETAEQLARQDPAQHERTLFIMSLLYGMYLRISELVAQPRWSPKMGDFQRDADGAWWFTTVGKGNKMRQISVSDALLKALKRYRLYLGLSALPTLGEQTPLISKIRGPGPVTSTRFIRYVVQFCFDKAMERLQLDGLNDEAEQLSRATVHWLRHTGISDDVKHRPREHVRDDAGHSSSAITDRYIDIELRERHASARKKQLRPDSLPEES